MEPCFQDMQTGHYTWHCNNVPRRRRRRMGWVGTGWNSRITRWNAEGLSLAKAVSATAAQCPLGITAVSYPLLRSLFMCRHITVLYERLHPTVGKENENLLA